MPPSPQSMRTSWGDTAGFLPPAPDTCDEAWSALLCSAPPLRLVWSRCCPRDNWQPSNQRVLCRFFGDAAIGGDPRRDLEPALQAPSSCWVLQNLWSLNPMPLEMWSPAAGEGHLPEHRGHEVPAHCTPRGCVEGPRLASSAESARGWRTNPTTMKAVAPTAPGSVNAGRSLRFLAPCGGAALAATSAA